MHLSAPKIYGILGSPHKAEMQINFILDWSSAWRSSAAVLGYT